MTIANHPAPARPRTRAASGPLPLVLFGLAVLLAGCGLLGGDDTAEQDPTASDTAVPATAAEDDPPGTPTAPSTPTDPPDPTTPEPPDDGDELPSSADIAELGPEGTCSAIGPEWCEDADGNGFPDFVEVELGLDPASEDCGADTCPVSLDGLTAQLEENTLFILDASGSMAGDAGDGRTKMEAARQALIDYVTVSPTFADLGLLVYGHRGDNSDAGRPESCAGIEPFAEIGALTPDAVAGIVEPIAATGWTPIAASLEAAGPLVQAAADADAAEGVDGAANRVVLISDGLETCDGDPVAAAAALAEAGLGVVVDVIGFDLAEADRAALAEVAEVTGGRYTDAATGAALDEALASLAAERAEAVEALNCHLATYAEFINCRIDLSAQGGAVMADAAAEIAGDDGRLLTFISSWSLAVQDRYAEENDRLETDLLARLEEYEQLLAEASARAEQVRAEFSAAAEVSWRCPHAADAGVVV